MGGCRLSADKLGAESMKKTVETKEQVFSFVELIEFQSEVLHQQSKIMQQLCNRILALENQLINRRKAGNC